MLFTDHCSNYRIVVPMDAPLPVAYAAGELSRYLEAISACRLPIGTDDSLADEEFCLGQVARSDKPDNVCLSHDGYTLDTRGKRIFVVSDSPRGVLFGVYALLEEAFGCRFFTEKAEWIPKCGTLALPDIHLTRVSPFEYRDCFWHEVTSHPDFAAKRGMNGMMDSLRPEQGDSIRYHNFVHTFIHHYVKLEDYAESHPEYYSMIDGKRKLEKMGTQLCLTNPEVLQIVIKQLKQDIAEHPECKIFSLSQNDCYFPCACPECARIDAEEGSHAGTMLRFVNACADAIAQEHPDIIIDTLAYHYTRQAPKITKPRPNVTVRLCTIEGCFSHPLEDCDVVTCEYYKRNMTPDMSLRKDFNEWGAICNRLSIWDYQTNFTYYLNPMANIPVLQTNMQYFVRNHVTSLFEQGNAQSPSGEMGELKAYLTCKLMWEPDGDVTLWTREFLAGYYGQAAGPIGCYLDMFHKHVAEANVHMGIRVPPDWGHMPPEILAKAKAYFDEAELLAESDEVLDRVQRSRLAIRFVEVSNMQAGEARDKAIDAFETDVHRLGVTHLAESRDLALSFEHLRKGTWT